MVKTVIFDVDGTLLDTERIRMRAWQEVAQKAGFDMPMSILLKTRGVSKIVSNRIYKEAMGDSFDTTLMRKLQENRTEELIYASDALLKPGVIQTLDFLKEHNIPVAVASTTVYEVTKEHLKHAGLYHYFGAVVGGDMVKNGKPEPDIFLLAAQQLGVEPKACMVVEDSHAGIRAAFAARMQPIMIPDCVPVTEEIVPFCTGVLDSMEKLPEMLKTVI